MALFLALTLTLISPLPGRRPAGRTVLVPAAPTGRALPVPALSLPVLPLTSPHAFLTLPAPTTAHGIGTAAGCLGDPLLAVAGTGTRLSGPFSRQRFSRCPAPALLLRLRLRLVAHVVHGLLFRVVRFPYASYASAPPV
ncbi:hypothetical protein ACIRU3_03760 [Streptomyces sp. NPDC101151]|uniref:hypothetical protein n=1 Tax=Streptomyces sp. NPDC101151 TaxID=3366115 RepID=UPI0037FCED3D